MVQCKNFCSQDAGIMQQLDSRIVEKINDLVNEGISNVREIERILASYAKFELFKDATTNFIKPKILPYSQGHKESLPQSVYKKQTCGTGPR